MPSRTIRVGPLAVDVHERAGAVLMEISEE
jgi:hypothetical protein